MYFHFLMFKAWSYRVPFLCFFSRRLILRAASVSPALPSPLQKLPTGLHVPGYERGWASFTSRGFCRKSWSMSFMFWPFSLTSRRSLYWLFATGVVVPTRGHLAEGSCWSESLSQLPLGPRWQLFL